jgi:hypothetical protein
MLAPKGRTFYTFARPNLNPNECYEREKARLIREEAIIARFAHIPVGDAYAAWLGVAGYVILVIGCTVKTA